MTDHMVALGALTIAGQIDTKMTGIIDGIERGTGTGIGVGRDTGRMTGTGMGRGTGSEIEIGIGM